MFGRFRLVVIAAFGLGIAAVTACQLLAGIDNRVVYDSGAGGDGSDPCANLDVPGSPGLNTSLPTDSVTFTMALSKIMLGATDGGPYYGFNLDQTCTCPGPDSCTRTATQGQACDDPKGVDNYARRIFEDINNTAMQFGADGGLITEDKFNSALKTGVAGALITVSKYNGKADDGAVTVTVYGSLGNETYPTPPKFDGTDRWSVDPVSASGFYRTTNAYVANFTLVAGLDFPIIIGSAVSQPVYIQLKYGDIVATLTTDGTGVVTKLTGTLGGRWDPAKFLPSLQVIPDPILPGSYLCGSDPAYGIVKKAVCKNTDINIDPGTPGLCNAVSMGLAFEATPAIVGNSKNPPDAGFPCDAGWTDQCP